MLLVASRRSRHFFRTATQQPYLVQVSRLCDRQRGQAGVVCGVPRVGSAGPSQAASVGAGSKAQKEALRETRHGLGSARPRTNRFSPAAGSLAPRPSPWPAPFFCPLLG